ncbi:hypothetical protein NQ318_021643 [Aromia moschata]|uniref:DUF4817 domain-containing protein n=1 Tax=Aromia moschata TaxID=1265417 RepID=A0AAV8XUV9_9CUCU|nr:hypothetical protein NQ318_021643 [Aromia moschata]
MSYLTESLKIEILMMIGYGDRARTQCEVVRLFRETHPDLPPLNQGTISKIEAQYREMGHVMKVLSKRQAIVDDDTKLNLLLALEENPITPARQLARDSNLNHKTVLKILKYEKKRPYKMQAVQELLEDDPATRPFFFDDTLNGARYLRLLQHELMPVLCNLFPNPLNPNLTDESALDSSFHQLYNEGSQAIGLHLKKIMSRVVSATPEGLYFSYYLQNVVEENPKLSLGKRSAQIDISKTHIQRILAENKFKAFKPKIIHTLEVGDDACRLDFCLEKIGARLTVDMHFHKMAQNPSSCTLLGEFSYVQPRDVTRSNCNCIDITKTIVHEIVSESLGMRKVCAKLVP